MALQFNVINFPNAEFRKDLTERVKKFKNLLESLHIFMASSHMHIFMIPLRSPAATDYDALITPLGPPTNSCDVIKNERDEFRQAFSESVILAFYSVRMTCFFYCFLKLAIYYLYFKLFSIFVSCTRLCFSFSIIA